MIKIGLTGGIGSGKTTVAQLFEKLGIPVYYADDRAKELMLHNTKIKKQLIRHFGKNAFIDGKLNRKYLAELVFNDKNKLKELESIVHPAVRKDFTEWAKKQTAPYIIVENAILYKSGMDQLVDYVIVVTTDTEKRFERIIKRDKIDKEEIEKRINNQEKESELLKKANFTISNNNNIEHLRKNVKLIDKKLKTKLKKS